MLFRSGTFSFFEFTSDTPSAGSKGLSLVTGSSLSRGCTVTSPDYSGTYLLVFTMEVLSTGAGTITIDNPVLTALTVPGGLAIGGVWWNTSEEIAHNTGDLS